MCYIAAKMHSFLWFFKRNELHLQLYCKRLSLTSIICAMALAFINRDFAEDNPSNNNSSAISCECSFSAGSNCKSSVKAKTPISPKIGQNESHDSKSLSPKKLRSESPKNPSHLYLNRSNDPDVPIKIVKSKRLRRKTAPLLLKRRLYLFITTELWLSKCEGFRAIDAKIAWWNSFCEFFGRVLIFFTFWVLKMLKESSLIQLI